jgi:hypothetical protein
VSFTLYRPVGTRVVKVPSARMKVSATPLGPLSSMYPSPSEFPAPSVKRPASDTSGFGSKRTSVSAARASIPLIEYDSSTRSAS